LIVDTALETSWAPVEKLNGSVGLDDGNSGVGILANKITSVHDVENHIFSVFGVTFSYRSSGLKSGVDLYWETEPASDS
jgi:hypothetical protein